MKGFIIAATPDTIDEKTIVRLFGRLENGRSFVSTNTILPYFFLRTTDAEKHSKIFAKYTLESTTSTTFKGESVVKIIAKNQESLNKLAEALHKLEMNTFEA